MKSIAGASFATATLGCESGPVSAQNIASQASASSAEPPFRAVGGGDFASITLAQVPIGGGGFVTGVDVSSDGSLLACRTDVTNAYVRQAADKAWSPLFSPLTMSRRDYDPLPEPKDKADGLGVAGIRIAPSNPRVVYASFCGFLWKSTDGGKTIGRTALPQTRMMANAGLQRLYNRTIDVDPRNADVVLVGTWGEGAWLSVDGGGRWSKLALPDALASLDGQPGIHLVHFDQAQPQRVFVFVTGHGLFSSETGPSGVFRLKAGGPLHCSSLTGSSDGSLYLCQPTKEQSGGKVWRYRSGAGWFAASPPEEPLVAAVDPRNASRIILINPNGGCMESRDACQSFERCTRTWNKGGEVAWISGLQSLFPAEIRFHPREDRLLVAHGVGVANLKVLESEFQLRDASAGIEELCASSALCVPGGGTYLSSWDKPIWRVDDLTAYRNDFNYPVAGGTKHSTDLVAFASYLDYAPEDPSFLVSVVAPSDKSAPGFSSDGGKSWRAFESVPESGWGYGGAIAAGSRQNIVLLPSNNGIGVYTLDGGKSWAPVRLGGGQPTGGFSNAYYVARKNVSADKTRPGTFALIYTSIKNNDYAEPLAGVWLTRDGGRSWAQVLRGVVNSGPTDPRRFDGTGADARQFWQCQLDYVPGHSAELVYTPHADYPSDRFFWSRDDGRSWAELHKSIRNVRAFGFGKAAAGQTRPALYFWGEVSGREGLYASLDWFASTPKLITRFPSPRLAKVNCITGDPDRGGRLYVGTGCGGWVRIELGT